jgi:hypothetical protein
MSTENIRFYIRMRTALNIAAPVIYKELYSVYGEQAVLEQLKDDVNDSVKVKKNSETKHDLVDLLLKQLLKISNKSVLLFMMISMLQQKKCKIKLV